MGRAGWSWIGIALVGALIAMIPMTRDGAGRGALVNALAETPAVPWTIPLRRAEEATARQDLRAADQTWQEAYWAAHASRRWEGMVEVGDAYLRIGRAFGFRAAAEARARQLYLAGLFHSRQSGSLDGVLRVAEAFAALGDREVVEQSLRVAEHLALRARDTQAQDRVRAFRKQLTARVLDGQGP